MTEQTTEPERQRTVVPAMSDCTQATRSPLPMPGAAEPDFVIAALSFALELAVSQIEPTNDYDARCALDIAASALALANGDHQGTPDA